MRRAFTHSVIYAVFFFSGVAALTYEVSWSRQIGLLFGHTVAAAATVLASYFAGLALGYWLAGIFSARFQRPLLTYGFLEIATGVGSLFVPLVLSWLHSNSLAPLIHLSNPALQLLVRTLACLFVMLPATIMLGATLPVMARWLESTGAVGTSRFSWAYGLNTCGGLVGVLLTTLVLLSEMGVTASNYLAAGVSGACGLAAIALHALLPVSSFDEQQSREGDISAARRVDCGRNTAKPSAGCWGGFRWSLPTVTALRTSLLVGVSGFVTLAVEVLYTRLFSLVFHNSTYTFGLVVAVVLAGLALGAWLAAGMGSRFNTHTLARWAMLLAGGAIAVSTLVFLQRTRLSYFEGGESFVGYMAGCLGLVALVVLPPITLLGMVLPLLWQIALAAVSDHTSSDGTTKPFRAGRNMATTVGRLTAINTLAASAGAILASFVMLPLFDLWGSFSLLAATCMLASLLLFGRQKPNALITNTLQGDLPSDPLAQSLSCNSAEASPSLLSAHVGFVAVLISTSCVLVAAWRFTSAHQGVPPGKELLLRESGAYGWIDVLRSNRNGTLSLCENVNYTHGSTASAQWEQRQGHIPLLLHPQPKTVLFLGCGTGATAGSATVHAEVESIEIAELIPEVIDAARMFESSNLGVLDNPRTRVHIDDARHTLLASERRWDVIISDLFVPWESKTGYLYTVDHYRIARDKLRPGGIFCQWLAMWQLGEEEFAMIADSFSTAFPYTTLWWGKVEFDRSIIGLIGSENPLRLNDTALQARLASIHEKTDASDRRLRSAEHLGRLFIGRWKPSPAGLRNTDEHPRLEFAMPLTYAQYATLKRRDLQAYYQSVLATLAAEGVEYSNFEHAKVNPSDRRHWHQIQLRK